MNRFFTENLISSQPSAFSVQPEADRADSRNLKAESCFPLVFDDLM